MLLRILNHPPPQSVSAHHTARYIRKPYKLMVGHFGDGSWSVEPTGRYLYNNDTNVIDMIEQEGTSTKRCCKCMLVICVFCMFLALVYAAATVFSHTFDLFAHLFL